MIAYPKLNDQDEKERLNALLSFEVAGTAPEPEFDRITALAADLFDVPIALATLLDEEKQWFKSAYGTNDRSTSRDVAFCNHVIASRAPLVVPDAMADPRFSENPLVSGPMGLRFYAGAPLIGSDDQVLGSLCLIDTKPREALSPKEMARLQTLASMMMSELELRREMFSHRRTARELTQIQAKLEMSLAVGQMAAWSHDLASGEISYSGAFDKILGNDVPEHHSTIDQIFEKIHSEDVEHVREALEAAKTSGEPFIFDFRITNPDGQVRWVQSRGQFTDIGPMGTSFGIYYDVTRPHEEVQQKELLMRELRHRMQNLFATINAIITLTRRAATSVDDYVDRVRGRLTALSRAQRVLLDQDFSSGSFTQLIGELQELYPRIHASGAALTLNDRQLISLSLVLTELATNAIKYGGLSYADGHVDLAWKVTGKEGDQRLAIVWKEVSPDTAEPCGFTETSQGTGFGTQLIDRTIVQNLHGKLERDWQSGSLCCTITIPMH